jgi:hypothetical protein
MGTGSSGSGGINLDVLMEWYVHQVVQDSVKLIDLPLALRSSSVSHCSCYNILVTDPGSLLETVESFRHHILTISMPGLISNM